jgi:hypothetical protein
MSDVNKNLVAVLPDGKDYFAAINFRAGENRQSLYRDVAQDAVRKAGITTPRKDPKTVHVKMFVLKIDNGQLKREEITGYDVTPPMVRMTENEFYQEREELVMELPVEFHSAVNQMAWEHGHSAGYEEVINYLRELVSNLKPCIEKYKANHLKGTEK